MAPAHWLRDDFFRWARESDRLTVQTFPAWRTWSGRGELVLSVGCLATLALDSTPDVGRVVCAILFCGALVHQLTQRGHTFVFDRRDNAVRRDGRVIGAVGDVIWVTAWETEGSEAGRNCGIGIGFRDGPTWELAESSPGDPSPQETHALAEELASFVSHQMGGQPAARPVQRVQRGNVTWQIARVGDSRLRG